MVESFDISKYIHNSVSVRYATGSEPLLLNTTPNFMTLLTTKRTNDVYDALVEFYQVAYKNEDIDHYLQTLLTNPNPILSYVYVFKDLKLHSYRHHSKASQSTCRSYIQALYLKYSDNKLAAYLGQV